MLGKTPAGTIWVLYHSGPWQPWAMTQTRRTNPIVRRVCGKLGVQWELSAGFWVIVPGLPGSKSHCPRVPSGLEPILSRLAFYLALSADLIRMRMIVTHFRRQRTVYPTKWLSKPKKISGSTIRNRLQESLVEQSNICRPKCDISNAAFGYKSRTSQLLHENWENFAFWTGSNLRGSGYCLPAATAQDINYHPFPANRSSTANDRGTPYFGECCGGKLQQLTVLGGFGAVCCGIICDSLFGERAD